MVDLQRKILMCFRESSERLLFRLRHRNLLGTIMIFIAYSTKYTIDNRVLYTQYVAGARQATRYCTIKRSYRATAANGFFNTSILLLQFSRDCDSFEP